jgi:two-component system LytT family sensor kinase
MRREMTTLKYWYCQVLGWIAFGALGLTLNVLNGGRFRVLLITHILFILYSIGLTHLFRRQIQKRRARNQRGASLWLFLAAGVSLISGIQTALIILTSSFIAHEYQPSWPPSVIAALEWGMFMGTGIWTIMYIRLTEKRRQETQEVQLKLALREAELRALESQINPHFLFNCLNSIRALVLIDPPRSQDMLTRLANVLRHSLRHDRQHTVPLASEVEAVSDYLALEAVRFEERLRVQVVIDPAAAQCAIPPMLLQTLVENAIKHGIAQVSGNGDLIIRAERQGGVIRLTVENTGQLSDAPANPNQFGIANTRERLRLLYGDQASLNLNNGNGRVIATVQIPA